MSTKLVDIFLGGGNWLNLITNQERTKRKHAQNMKKHEFLKISKARKTSDYKSFNDFKLFGFMLTTLSVVDI